MDVVVGTVTLLEHARGLQLRVNLDECPVHTLQRLVRSVTYECLKPLTKVLALSVLLTVRGGARVAPTAVTVQLAVVPKPVRIGRDGFGTAGVLPFELTSLAPCNFSADLRVLWAGKAAGVSLRCALNSTPASPVVALPSFSDLSDAAFKASRKRAPSRQVDGFDFPMTHSRTSRADCLASRAEHMLQLRLPSPYRVSKGAITRGAFTVASVSDVDEGVSFGIEVVMSRDEKLASAALQAVASSFWLVHRFFAQGDAAAADADESVFSTAKERPLRAAASRSTRALRGEHLEAQAPAEDGDFYAEFRVGIPTGLRDGQTAVKAYSSDYYHFTY
ncbi:hypothetical protein DIPPA_27107 [Diplonema papillatum]|nr:hypothetical protein DIPPA_27107 [Diplonema papillatum]